MQSRFYIKLTNKNNNTKDPVELIISLNTSTNTEIEKNMKKKNDDTISNAENLSKEQRGYFIGGSKRKSSRKNQKKKPDDIAENPFVAIVVVKELFYYNKIK